MRRTDLRPVAVTVVRVVAKLRSFLTRSLFNGRA